MKAPVREITTDRPDIKIIEEAAGIIRSGGLVVFPTSGLYGIAADAFNPAAVKRVFAAKGRSETKALSVLIETPEKIGSITASVPRKAQTLMDRFWPGGLTIIFPAAAVLPEELIANTGTIAVRLPAHPVALALVRKFGGAITATSANLSGAQGVFQICDLTPEVAERVDLILDSGKLKGGAGSTIVDATQAPPAVLREGAISTADITAALQN